MGDEKIVSFVPTLRFILVTHSNKSLQSHLSQIEKHIPCSSYFVSSTVGARSLKTHGILLIRSFGRIEQIPSAARTQIMISVTKN